jgi:hypothetical protein
MADPNWKNRTLFHCDNLPVLRAMNSESVDLIATDPVMSRVPWKSSGVASAELGYLSWLAVVKPERREVIAFREAA